MDFHLVLKKLDTARFFIGLIIIGLIFTAVGAIFVSQPKTDLVKTDATVTNIHDVWDDVSESNIKVGTITYLDADGKSHSFDDHALASNVKENDTIEVSYDPSDPDLPPSDVGAEFLPYVLLAVGILAFLFGAVKTVMVVRTPISQTNDFNKVEMEDVSEAQIDAIRQNDEETKEYYFHFTGKLNQSYILETTSRQPIMEAVSQKLSLFTKYQFNFINHLSHREGMKEVTHTVSTSYGSGSVSVTTDSHFKIDGVNCWEALGKLGYSLEPHLSGLHITFDVKKYGVPVAFMEQAGANVATGKEYKLGNIPTNGVYTVKCRESDLEGVFLACFIVSRTYR